MNRCPLSAQPSSKECTRTGSNETVCGCGLIRAAGDHIRIQGGCMAMEHVVGKKKGDVKLYALSTCVWCKKTKQLLNELGVDYHYTFVDLLPEDERQMEPRLLVPDHRYRQQNVYCRFQTRGTEREVRQMNGNNDVTEKDIDTLVAKLKKDAEAGAYNLNPDTAFVKELAAGLLENEARYGYPSCPCRLASGEKRIDLDIICPCDYRDPDVSEHGACYCALYVSQDVAKGVKMAGSIPERRPPFKDRQAASRPPEAKPSGFTLPVWRCKVCGYLCARDNAPDVCPICKAKKERFERFA
jgi:ferredoxin-thioredoxin reductase catalytic subunit